MPFPAAGALSSGAVTGAGQKQNLEDFLAQTRTLIGANGPGPNLVINSGSITPNRGMHQLQPESGNQDDLTTIDTVSLPGGSLMMLRIADNSYAINVTNAINIRLLYQESSLLLSHQSQWSIFWNNGGLWTEIIRSGLEDKRPLALSPGFANGAVAVRAWRDSAGYVNVEGMAQYSGTIATDTSICTLPNATYVPSASQVWLPAVHVNGLQIVPIKVAGTDIRYEGQSLSNPLIDMSPIRFRTD